MSLLKEYIVALKRLIIPEICPLCGKRLIAAERFICLSCYSTAPYTNQWKSRDNMMEQRFWGIVPIERAAAFLWYIEDGGYRDLIHLFKYHSQWFVAQYMGSWFATELTRCDFLDGVDLIVPIPLYITRRLSREYNQSEYIAIGISRYAKIPYCFNAVRRVVNNPSQTVLEKEFDRWGNVEGIFKVVRPEKLKSRHILLVDDVFTTGATIISCAQSIIKSCNGDVKISVATLAASQYMFGEQ